MKVRSDAEDTVKSRRVIVIAATGRSGTTWLQNLLAAPLDFRLIFEPLHPEVSGNEEFNRLYLEAGDVHEPLRTYLEDAIRGKIRNRWMLQGGQGDRRHFYRNRWWAPNVVLKLIRANLMLEWLERNLDGRIVYSIRHPCAVVASKMRLGWGRKLGRVMDFIMSQEKLVTTHLEPHRDVIETMNRTLAQRHALLWCIENLVPLRQFGRNKWVGCVYEYLYMKPKEELDRIYSELGIRRPSKVDREIEKMSHTGQWKGGARAQGDVLSKWERELSGEEISEILAVVDAFGMKIYARDPLPVASRVEQMMGIRSPI